METVGGRAGFLLARTRVALSSQTSVDQGHTVRNQKIAMRQLMIAQFFGISY